MAQPQNQTSEVLFIGDAWETLDHPRDTTLYLAQVAAEEFGIRSYWGQPTSIFFRDGDFRIRLCGEVTAGNITPIYDIAASSRSLSSFQSVHWRADPPVEISTLRLWSLLATASRIKLLNPPQALLTWNEKFAPFRFGDWSVPTLVSDSVEGWQSFFEAHSAAHDIVAKPSGEAASRGVAILPDTWPEALDALKKLRAETGPWIVLQPFEPTLLTEGETRVFVIESEIAGALNKRPKKNHPIMSLDAPAADQPSIALATLTAEQRARAEHIIQALNADGVYVATIDFIGSRILEINITSPGLIKWMDSQLPKSQSIARKYWLGITR
jgi:glutathione synthase